MKGELGFVGDSKKELIYIEFQIGKKTMGFSFESESIFFSNIPVEREDIDWPYKKFYKNGEKIQ